ncbi:hypothetical protein [Streptomyces sp. NBC_00503]|uniref:hypothetical protein n=1 Tax=Streptomyces sp. NBC_00503 TaxID=2903659 RepID=UPI002E81545C|nr:hypothetical protein [Streptomyces sp. NBC_00503]WUD86527.1 hypothetical protein OG490_38665 [Streptomyces sp. NBC_00503]
MDFAVELTALDAEDETADASDGAVCWAAAVRPPFDGEEAEVLAFFLDADPWFTLRRPDGTTTTVEATYAGDVNRLRLHAR